MTLEERYYEYMQVAPKMTLSEYAIWCWSIEMTPEVLTREEYDALP